MDDNRKIIILGATGFVGKALVESLLKKSYQVIAIGRMKSKLQECFADKVEKISWTDFNNRAFDSEKIACVINLAGASIADKRWTKAHKINILESRLKATDDAVKFCLENKVTLLNASAIGIYGLQKAVKGGLPARLDEDSNIPLEGEAEDFLSFVCRSWEAKTAPIRKAGIRTVNMRIGVVIGKGGGALEKMAMPFHLFAGGPIGSGHQPMSWISLKDICRAIHFMIETESIKGPVNLVAPECLIQKDFAKVLGRFLKRPSFMPTPGFMLKVILGKMADELLLNGQHVYPARLLEQGFEFQYPTINDVLKNIYD